MNTWEIILCIESHIMNLYFAADRASARDFYNLHYIISRLTDLADNLQDLAYREYLANN